MNIGLPAAVGKDLFGRDGGAEDLEDGSGGDLHSCQSGRYREEDVAYVIDGELAAECRGARAECRVEVGQVKMRFC